jgi:hypothetical protein
MLDAMGAGARALLDSAERLEGAVALDGGVVDLNVALSVKEGSALDTPPAKGAPLLDLAKSIDAKQCAMTMLMCGDFSTWLDAFMPFMRSMYAGLPDSETRLKRYLQAYRAMYEAMGPSFVMGMDFDADGIRLAGAMRPKDGAAYLARYREAVVEGSVPEMGVTITPGEPVEVDGAKLDVFKVDLDWHKLMASAGPTPPGFDETLPKVMDAMFGPDGIRYAQGIVGDCVIMAMAARDGSLEHAVATAKEQSGGLAPVVAAAVRDDTTFLFHVDVRRMLRSTIALMSSVMPQGGQAPTIPDGAPVDLWLRVGQDGRTYACALHADAGGVVGLTRH